MSEEVQKLAETLSQMAKRHVKVQTAWAIVKSVDWGERTMVATGVADDLDYLDVLLGLGSIYRKPKPGDKCLIGLVENQDEAAFLIDAEQVEEMIVTVGGSELRVTEEGFSLKKGGESLKEILEELLKQILQMTVTTAVGPSGTPVNAAAFQAIQQRVPQLFIG